MGVICLQASLTAGMVYLRAHESACGVYLTDGLGPCGNLVIAPEGADDGVAACVLGHTEVLGEHKTPAALDLGDEVRVDGLVGGSVGVAHMR